MKTNTIILSLIILLGLSSIYAQKSKIETIKINTSGQCSMCKERIEKALVFEKGIKNADYDIETAVVTIKYNTTKTTPDKIKKVINLCGYDADDSKADEAAYQKLPNCCKKPDDPNHIKH